jgi:hypothetical protein
MKGHPKKIRFGRPMDLNRHTVEPVNKAFGQLARQVMKQRMNERGFAEIEDQFDVTFGQNDLRPNTLFVFGLPDEADYAFQSRRLRYILMTLQY